jgi:hypothetical protein
VSAIIRLTAVEEDLLCGKVTAQFARCSYSALRVLDAYRDPISTSDLKLDMVAFF